MPATEKLYLSLKSCICLTEEIGIFKDGWNVSNPEKGGPVGQRQLLIHRNRLPRNWKAIIELFI